jgi:hypothetical protein
MTDALATISDNRTRRRGNDWGTGLSPAIERARAAREPKPQKPVAAIKPAPVIVQAIAPPSIEITGRVLAIFADYNGQWAAIRERVEAMGITRLQFDHLTGLQEGYSGKLLGEAQRRRFGKESLGATLGGIGCKLVLVEDPAATAKIMARVEKRKRKQKRPLKLLAPPSQARP